MENQEVSVVITTYGRRYKEIENSIKSVLNQSYKKLELIIVDDNGKENFIHKDIAEKLKKLNSGKVRLLYVVNEKNVGAQVSRNKGILTANGEYIAFLDDDDLWEPEKIELQIKKFNNNVGLVYCKGWTVELDEDQKEKKRSSYNMSESFIEKLSFEDLSYGDYIGTTSQVIIKKEAFAECGLFDVNQPARQDYEMWIRISKKYQCEGVNEYLFSHIQHSGEQISKNPQKAAIGIYNIYNKYKKDCSWTSRWHLLWLSYKAQKRVKFNYKTIRILMKSILGLGMAVLFDRNNFLYRLRIHKSRIAGKKK